MSDGENANDDAQSRPSGGEIPPEKLYYLHKIQLLQEVQDELVSWGKRRFWIVALTAVIIGLFGMNLFIKEFVRELVDKEISVVKARTLETVKATALAEDSATRARAATEKASSAHSDTIAALENRARSVDVQFVQMSQRLEAESSSVKASGERDTKTVAQQLAKLETLVTGLAAKSEANRTLLDTYQKQVADLQAKTGPEGIRVQQNSQFFVSVEAINEDDKMTLKDSRLDRLAAKLREAGFKTFPMWRRGRPGEPNQHHKDDLEFERLPAANAIAYRPASRARALEVQAIVNSVPSFVFKELIQLPPREASAPRPERFAQATSIAKSAEEDNRTIHVLLLDPPPARP